MTTLEAHWDLTDGLDAPGVARRLTADTLVDWGVAAMAETAQLLVSELVTNAVIHAHSASRLELRLDPTTLWIGVHDVGRGEPAIGAPRPTGGLGLRIVDQLSAGWRIVHTEDRTGKAVWCELPRP